MMMLNKKIIFASLCFAFLCLHTMGFSLDVPQEKQEVAACPSLHDHIHLLAKKKKHQTVYYLYVQDFLNSMIAIPTSNVAENSSTIESQYLAGRAPIYRKG